MKNEITKYLIEDKQMRLYLLRGEQIYMEIEKLNLSQEEKVIFKSALNITALINGLSTGKQRISLSFLSQKGENKISTESFFNNTITGTTKFSSNNLSFKGGTLNCIATLNAKYGNSYTSYSLLESGNLYHDIENYYSHSEQTSTYFFPISDNQNPKNTVILIQALPFANDKTVAKVIERINLVKESMANTFTGDIDTFLFSLFSDCMLVESIEITYSCGCSKDMFLGIIFSLSKEEINNVVLNNGSLEVACSLCGKKYRFFPEDILPYLQ